jgi:hypothetical protein
VSREKKPGSKTKKKRGPGKQKEKSIDGLLP